MENKIDNNNLNNTNLKKLNEMKNLNLSTNLIFDDSMYICVEFLKEIENNLSIKEIKKICFKFSYFKNCVNINIKHMYLDKIIFITFIYRDEFKILHLYFGESHNFDLYTELPNILVNKCATNISDKFINNDIYFTGYKFLKNEKSFKKTIDFIKIFLFKSKNISVKYSKYLINNIG